MLVTNISWTKYRVPFVKPFETAHGQMLVREGLLVKVTSPRFTGWGEIAPLPDFGEGGTVSDALALLQAIAPQIIGQALEQLLAGQLEAVIEQASQKVKVTGQVQSTVRFGLELAFYDILARANNQPLAEFWGAKLTPIEVNATIGTPDIIGAVEAAHRLVQAGYNCIKLKVGITNNEVAEMERVAAVRYALDKYPTASASPRRRLRLDANEAWTIPQAISLLKQMAQYDLELVEQPIAGQDIAGLAQVQSELDFPVAADEAVINVQAVQQIINLKAARVLVIKPAMVGGVQAARTIIKMAEEAGLHALVTTSLETGVGIAGAFHLALTLKRPALACGLATAQLLESTLVTNLPVIQNGLMLPTALPGLGVEVKLD